MRSSELLLLPSLICALCVAHAIAGGPDGDHKPRPSFVAQFFHGKHVTRAHQHPWNEYDDSSSSDEDDEDDYKPLDTSESEDEGQTNSTAVRHSSEQQTGYDSDDSDDRDNRRRNYFLIHRAKKQQRTKGEQRFVWHPFTPSFLINFEPYAPVSPLLLSKWSRKPNDILLVVLQQRTPPPPAPAAAASCTCDRSQNQTRASIPTSGDDLRKERNESSSSSASVVDEPHLATADWPSSCVFAIVACCSPNNYHFRYGCFPYLGCSIALWDTEPCQLPTMIEASRQAHTYYDQLDRPRPDVENHPATEGDVHAGTDEGNVPAAGGEGGAQSGTKPTTSTAATTTTTSTTTTTASVTTAVPEETTAA